MQFRAPNVLGFRIKNCFRNWQTRMNKKYLREASTFQPIAIGFGSCIASDRITVAGAPVGLMYREKPENDLDSGWRFLAGDESQAYADNPQNFGLFDVNTIANYDPMVCEHLESAIGTAFIRKGDCFRIDDEFEFHRE